MQLKPLLGTVQLIFYGVGMIIGAGVYSIIGAAGVAQQGLWASFILAAVVALLTGFSYAEMATSFPRAGAEYLHLRRAFPEAKWPAFMVGVLMLAGGVATASTVAVAFGGYFRTFADMPAWLAAVALLVACTSLNVWGLRESSWVNILFTLIEVSGLILVIVAGFAKGNIAGPLQSPLGAGVLPAAAIVFFVYLGFEGIANLAEEVRDARRDLPRAIFYSIGITTTLYVLVSVAVLGLASPTELASSEAPLALAIQKLWPSAVSVLSAMAIFATANTVLIAMIVAPRLAFSMARNREIPEFFAALTPRRRTPWAAAALMLALSTTLVTLGDLKTLAELSSFAALLALLSVNTALIVLRFRMPSLRRPFRVPLAIARMPLLSLAAIGSICVLLANFNQTTYFIGAGVLAVSGLAYLLSRRLTNVAF
jgi:amino acid transporter